ncbi:MAG: peroxiredoxin [Silvanigrellales bacterium]|jgi:peroxiredoxin (alkyl hydroperoxide reductase subunit C)|nr:peroxiredoxin [Silvanigrellales bacterium]
MSVLVGRQAPNFKAEAVVGGGDFKEIQLSDYRDKKYVVLFFYPLDFTFVCPTELHAFQEKYEDFKKRDIELIACSIDSKFSHFAWLNTPKSQGGIEGVKFPLVSDIHRTIARDYDVLNDDGVAYRGLFLIDKKGMVRHQVVNDGPLGRSVDEALRTCDALLHVEKHGEVCPANWHAGDEAIKTTKESVGAYLGKRK